ncbi:MAG TPA: Holliday junction resolvase RuvX [Clostridia bacterium]|jgi:putative Holliday junction resolvase|nr:Holliday junction resolvase RuvX [Clostridia bacterium]
MRILGMDLGEKRIGLAVSDELGITAQGLFTLKRTELKEDLRQLVKIIQEKEITKLVVGLPKNMNGSLGPQADRVKSFVILLTKECPLEVVYWDERLTTVAAQRVLIEGDVSRKKRRKVVDKIAAVIILQSYLDNSR